MDFKKLKKKAGGLKKLQERIEKEQKGGGYKKDERLWTPKRDKIGNAYCVIRLLPISNDDLEKELESPWVKVFHHSFKGPGGWYIEKSRTTIDEDDPLFELNSEEWDDDDKAAQKRVRPRSRRKTYYCNVYVETDKNNPENEGKNFIWEFNQTVLDELIVPCYKPKFDDDPAFDPFDFWEGGTLKLKIYCTEKEFPDGSGKSVKRLVPKYDRCEWIDIGDQWREDDEMEKIWKDEHSIYTFVDPESFKSYDELQKRLNRVLKMDIGKKTASDISKPVEDEDNTPSDNDIDNMLNDISNSAESASDEPQPTLDKNDDGNTSSDESGDEDDVEAFLRELEGN